MTAAEVDELVKDQLRLLIHLGYLDNLWNGNPDPNPSTSLRASVGEGQWLFVERYSLRVAERLDTLILETQNLGLIVDLLVALQIHSTALAALAGDADYAQAEVEPLADFLETMLGDNLPGSQGYRHAPPPFWWGSALAMGDYNPAVLSGYEPEVAPEAVAVAQEQAQERIKGLAYPLWFQGSGDPNTDNNEAEMFFQTAPPTLPPGVLEILNQVMGGSTPLEFVWELLTGQSENWWAIGGNIVLSFVPIFGSIVDMIGLFTEPTLLGKAFALIGLVASIISDAAQVLTACGIAVPPALAALPAAVGSEIVDIGAAVLKGALKLLTSDVMRVVREIPFNRALDLAGDLLGHLGRAAYQAADGNWPLNNLEAAVQLIRGVLNNVWDPFVALVKHFDGRLAELFALGFGDGGFLAGRVLKQGNQFSDVDKVVKGAAKIGDELSDAAAALSDEAVQGLGEVIDDAGEGGAEHLFQGLNCAINLVTGMSTKTVGLASPLTAKSVECNQPNLETALKIVGDAAQNWSDEALEGLGRVVRKVGEVGAQRLVALGDEASQQAFQVVASKGDNIWNADTVEGLARVFEKIAGERVLKFLTQEYSDEVVGETLTYIKNVNLAATDNVLERVDDLRDLFQWQAKGNVLSILDDPEIILRRLDMPDNEYQAFKQSIFNRWNYGQPMNGTRLAEAFAVEATIKRLQQFGNYEVVHVLTKEGGQGPDAILRNLNTGNWVILEGKGTLSGAPLDGDLFGNPGSLGRQLSEQWITTDPGRYLKDIQDPQIRNRVLDLVDDIRNGERYEVIVGRGGINSTSIPKPLDYGTKVDEFINQIRPGGATGEDWTIQFVFVNLLR